ncbi:TonB-dependent receptor domain-containing protein [Pendulispora albinea]|uniref:TonB-dependent receptor n=1 Tax=Pendulispora albinea TaxID=2741071 RepID=A0ABZ2M1H6_9BACT
MRLRSLDCIISAATLSAAIAYVAPAQAQVGAAVLTGKVVDAASKKGVMDAVVTVTSPALQGEQIVTTDNTGTYRIPSLPPGVYSLHLDKEGYRAYQRDEIQLRADSTIRLDADLLPEGLQAQEVVVVAHAPTVDVGSTTSGANINSDFTSRIPVTNPGARGGAQRSFESVAEATPGASSDTYGTSVNGSTSPENSYVIDGLRTNSARYGVNGSPLSIEFVKEVNVLSGGYLPEYGRSTGGILNVVTKSGSNEFHGSVWGNWTPGALEGARKYPYYLGTAIQTRRSLANIYDIGFDQSGPIIKDKLWYYVGFDVARSIYNLDRSIYVSRDGRTDIEGEQIPGSTQQYQASSTSYQIFAKLDYRINQNNKLALSFSATPTMSGGGGDFALNPNSGAIEVGGGNLIGTYTAMAHQRRSGSYDTILKWTTEFDNKSKNIETTIGWHHELGGTLGADGFNVGSGLGSSAYPNVVYRRSPNLWGLERFEGTGGASCTRITDPKDPTKTIPTCPLQEYRAGGPGFTDQNVLDVYAAKSVLTILAQGLGHHVIKAGAEFEVASSWNSRGYSGTRGLQETTSGSRFDEVRGYGYLTAPDQAVQLDRLVTRTHSINVGGFVQDSWSILDKVTVNAGVRWDNQFILGADGNLFMSFPNQFSPRVGVIFDPTQNGRSKIFASYARFNESVPLNIVDRGTGERGVRSSESAAQCNPLDPGQAQGVCQGAARPTFPAKRGWTEKDIPDRKFGPYSGGKIVDPDISVQSTSEFSAGGEYEILKNGRFGVSYVRRWMNNVVEDMSNDEGATFFIGNPGKGIAKGFPEATRNYDGGTVYFTKTFADSWLAQVSYTLSWLRGNLAGLYRPETGQLDPNSNSSFDLKSLLTNQQGDLPGDQRHSVKVFVAKDIQISKESNLNLGGSVQARSGGPTNFLGAHPLYGRDEAYILPRGTGDRLPWNGNVGTHVGYTWRFENGMSLGLTMDIFNLLNFQGALTQDERYTREDVLPIVGGSSADLKSVQTRAGSTLAPGQVNPNFGKATTYQEPRQFRFGIRGTF